MVQNIDIIETGNIKVLNNEEAYVADAHIAEAEIKILKVDKIYKPCAEFGSLKKPLELNATRSKDVCKGFILFLFCGRQIFAATLLIHLLRVRSYTHILRGRCTYHAHGRCTYHTHGAWTWTWTCCVDSAWTWTWNPHVQLVLDGKEAP